MIKGQFRLHWILTSWNWPLNFGTKNEETNSWIDSKTLRPSLHACSCAPTMCAASSSAACHRTVYSYLGCVCRTRDSKDRQFVIPNNNYLASLSPPFTRANDLHVTIESFGDVREKSLPSENSGIKWACARHILRLRSERQEFIRCIKYQYEQVYLLLFMKSTTEIIAWRTNSTTLLILFTYYLHTIT